MGRRPTIQTTVTVSLTKSSPGDCNQMLPVKFASKFVSFVILETNKQVFAEIKLYPDVECPIMSVEHINTLLLVS